MSDNDDIEVESDADKRAHHNALERKRRDHIKDSFHSLRDSVPSLQGEKSVRWRKRNPILAFSRTTHHPTAAFTPIPTAAPYLPSMGDPTPAPSPNPRNPKAERSYGWKQVKQTRAIKPATCTKLLNFRPSIAQK
ncbi:protein max isoform X6 [Engystomops pustulosus]|uniref:protein max isoform X6 n=1 Tax=Engystomops pustulosus TaxID=76066 RepID=UPI003AFA8C53